MTNTSPATHLDPGYRQALIASAVLNAVMFFAEGGVGLTIGSAALIADAVDFLEDAGIYSLGVIALAWKPRKRAYAGLVMALAMLGVGLVAVWQIVDRVLHGGAPASGAMAMTAAAALAVNVYCASRLARWKRGDASMRSIWLSTRNDAILNGVTIVAAGLVAWTATGWPDIGAGVLIAAINIWAAFEIMGQARSELKAAPT
jgi:Co/Zn/Cd efflux system component